MPRSLLFFLLAVASAVLALTGSAPAGAADATAATATAPSTNASTTADGLIAYTGELSEQQSPPAGDDADANQLSPKVSLVERFGIECLDGECRLFGITPAYLRGAAAGVRIPITLTDGQAAFVQESDPAGSDCAAPIARATMTVDATRDRITVVWTTQPFECSSGGDATVVRGLIQTWTGEYVEGNRCIVDPGDCPAPSTSASSPTEPTTEPPVEQTREDTTTGDGATDPPATTWSSPSRLSTLAPISVEADWAVQLCLTAAVTIILVLLIAFPTALLNSAIDRATASRVRPPRDMPHLHGWWQAGLGVLAAAVISGFIDPDFGLNAQSLRVFASILIAFTVDVIIGWSVLIWIVRRSNPAVTAQLQFKPFTLLIVVGAVVLTRLSGFEPGIVFGLVAGVAFSAAVALSHRAPAELVGLGYAFLIALLAWIGYSAMAQSMPDAAGAGAVFAMETLSSFAIAGVAALPIVLVPLRGLPGHSVYVWRRVAWAGAYFVALFTFFVMLMPLPASWAEVPLPLKTWVAIYVMYAAGAVAAWIIVRLVTPDAPAESTATVRGARRPSR